MRIALRMVHAEPSIMEPLDTEIAIFLPKCILPVFILINERRNLIVVFYIRGQFWKKKKIKHLYSEAVFFSVTSNISL